MFMSQARLCDRRELHVHDFKGSKVDPSISLLIALLMIGQRPELGAEGKH